MKSNRANRSILIVMIVSQVVLALFVSYWLNNQYSQGKRRLHGELSGYYQESRRQALDSAIYNSIVNPLRDSVDLAKLCTPHAFKDLNSDALINNVSSDTIINIGTFPLIDSSIALQNGSLPVIVDRTPRAIVQVPGEYVMANGVRMALANPKINMKLLDNISSSLSLVTDDLFFRKVFSEKLERNHLFFSLEWSESPLVYKDNKGGNRFYFSSRDGFFSAVEVKQYGYYLFNSILPQLIFAILLLGLCISSLWLVWRSLRKQMELNNLRSSFVSNISHELKTPVSTVKVVLEAIKGFDIKSNPNMVAEYIDIAELEMNRLDTLVGKVLNHARMEEKVGFAKKSPVDIVELIKAVIHSFKPQVEKTGAKISFTHTDSIIIPLDSCYTESIIINLLDNAIKYATETPEIDISIQENQNSFLINFRDAGPGIEEKYQSKLFDKFFRIPSGDKHNIKGYGLGLSFVLLAMQQHGGTVNVKNNEGKGCTFTLTFPKQ